MTTVIAVVATLVITALVTWVIASAHHKKVSDGKIGSAEERARKIIDEALKNAEDTKREKLLEAKEEALKTRNDLEKEVKDGKLRFKEATTTTVGNVTIGTQGSTVTFTVVNEPGAALPNAGGPGTTLFRILGTILIAFAAAGLVFMRKRSKAV